MQNIDNHYLNPIISGKIIFWRPARPSRISDLKLKVCKKNY